MEEKKRIYYRVTDPLENLNIGINIQQVTKNIALLVAERRCAIALHYYFVPF